MTITGQSDSTLQLPAARPPWRFVLRLCVERAIIPFQLIGICAVFVAFVLNHGRDVRRDLVYSLCVGMSIWLLGNCLRLALSWLGISTARRVVALICAVIIPPGYYLGLVIGASFLDEPLSAVLPAKVYAFAASMAFSFSIYVVSGWILHSRREIAEMRIRSAEQETLAARAEKRAVESQLRLLQAQIEPHMLFNTLANLQGLIDDDTQRAQKMLGHLIHYLRATLAISREQTVSLAQEFRKLDAYLCLMQVRLGKRLSFSLDLPTELANSRVPPMLLQPLVENSLKHGIEPKLGGGSVSVRAVSEQGVLFLTVVDTGMGIGEDGMSLHSKPGTRLGLENVRERLGVLYGGRASLSVAPHYPIGTIATISLPFE